MEIPYDSILASVASAAILTFFGWVARMLRKADTDRRERDKEQGRINGLLIDANRATLHDRLKQACTHYIQQGWCVVDDRKNLEYMFDAYVALGGNGLIADLFAKTMALPICERR